MVPESDQGHCSSHLAPGDEDYGASRTSLFDLLVSMALVQMGSLHCVSLLPFLGPSHFLWAFPASTSLSPWPIDLRHLHLLTLPSQGHAPLQGPI